MSQKSSPTFSFTSQPCLSQSEFGRHPNVDIFHLALKEQTGPETLVLSVWKGLCVPSVRPGRPLPLEGQSFSATRGSLGLRGSRLSAERRVWMPACVCNLAISAMQVPKVFSSVLSLSFVTDMSRAECQQRQIRVVCFLILQPVTLSSFHIL